MTIVPAALRALELSAQVKAELYPILIFFGMFFVVFGMGGVVVRHLPRKPGSMLDEILNETWEDSDDKDEKTEQELPDQNAEPAAGLLAENAEDAQSEDDVGK